MAGLVGEGAVAGGVPPAVAPHRVRLPVNIHRWGSISFLHWGFPPEAIASRVPDPLRVLTWEGRAWVGATPFVMTVRPPWVPVVPPGWSFPETNLRTYVAHPDGSEGVWFLHMEVTARWFTLLLRSLGLPYVTREMAVEPSSAVHYRSVPPPGEEGGHDIRVVPQAVVDPPEGGPAERFLTARWWAFHARGPILLKTPVAHPPWRLQTAAVERCDVAGLFRAAGIPPPEGEPSALFSAGTRVEVGLPRRVG